MPVGPGEEGGEPMPGLVTKRPDIPVYIEGERELDRIIIVDRPDTPGYILGVNEGAVYVAGVKIIYKCYKNYKPGNPNCWKIEMLLQTPVTTDGFEQTETKVMYPWGCAGYNFDPDHVRYYIYGFKY